MGSHPERYSATRISAVSMMSERRFEACIYEVNGVGWPIVVRVIVEHFIVANFQAIVCDKENTMHVLLECGAEIDTKVKYISKDSIYKEQIAKEILKRVCSFSTV